MPKKKSTAKINRQHHSIDASDRVAGRLASEIAILLMGKHKIEYQPDLNQGDYVEVENVSKLKFSGKKMEQKVYYRTSGYPGGLKKTTLNKIFKDKPEEVLRKMVLRMLPKNKLRKEMIKRLTIKAER